MSTQQRSKCDVCAVRHVICFTVHVHTLNAALRHIYIYIQTQYKQGANIRRFLFVFIKYAIPLYLGSGCQTNIWANMGMTNSDVGCGTTGL